MAGNLVDRDGSGRDNSTAKGGEPQSFDSGFVPPTNAKKSKTKVSSGHASEHRARTAEEKDDTTAGGNDVDEWGSWGRAAAKKKKKKRSRDTTEVIEREAETSVPEPHRNGGGSHSISSASNPTKSESSRSRSRTRARVSGDENADADSIELASPGRSDMDLYD